MIMHLIRTCIWQVRKAFIGPRLAHLANLSQGEMLNILEMSALGYGSQHQLSHQHNSSATHMNEAEIAALREKVAELEERIQALERSTPK